MKVQTFFTGLIASFGVAWLLVVAYPFFKLKDKQAVKWEDKDGKQFLYSPTAPNYVEGARIYRQENCQTCHTQVIRHSDAGSDVFRDWAGMKYFDEDGNLERDTRRESDARDYVDSYASIGSGRMGPDLINFGVRIRSLVNRTNKAIAERIESGELSSDIKLLRAEELVYLHLYNPRKDVSREEGQKYWSACPKNTHMFKKVQAAGQGLDDALPVICEKGFQIVPNTDAKHLTAYLLGQIHDQMLPESVAKGTNFLGTE